MAKIGNPKKEDQDHVSEKAKTFLAGTHRTPPFYTLCQFQRTTAFTFEGPVSTLNLKIGNPKEGYDHVSEKNPKEANTLLAGTHTLNHT